MVKWNVIVSISLFLFLKFLTNIFIGTIAHGASQFLRERMFNLSDKYRVPVCQKCGFIAESDSRKKINYCRLCDDYDHVMMMDLPYAAKLLFQELMSMLIAPRFQLE